MNNASNPRNALNKAFLFLSRWKSPTLVFLMIAIATLSVRAAEEGTRMVPGRPLADEGQTVDMLRRELQRLLEGQAPKPPQAVPAQARPRKGKPTRPVLDALERRAQELAREIRQRLYAELVAQIERELGPIQTLQSEEVLLEAMGKRRRVLDVPVQVQTRPLRRLTAPGNAAKAYSLVGSPDLGLALYDTLARTVAPADEQLFRRVFTGPDAQALATEIKLIVALKGGEWAPCPDGGRVANAIGVRGLDFDKGLLPNGNTTYDDTLYLVIEETDGATEVYEYRMTTESGSAARGVGRLDAKQVVYVRGLHRGKDPAYRLKGGSAEGTRQGMTGAYKILGANLHSAYSKRPIDAETPLMPNVSLGCQVVATSKNAFEQSVVSLLDKKGIREFPYAIVEGDEISVLDHALLDRSRHSLLIRGIPRKETPKT